MGDEGAATAVADDDDDDEDATSVGLTDWLADLDDDADTADAHAADNAAALNDLPTSAQPNERSRFLRLVELDHPYSRRFARAAGRLNVEDLPGWMDESGPIQTNLLDPAQIRPQPPARHGRRGRRLF